MLSIEDCDRPGYYRHCTGLEHLLRLCDLSQRCLLLLGHLFQHIPFVWIAATEACLELQMILPRKQILVSFQLSSPNKWNGVVSTLNSLKVKQAMLRANWVSSSLISRWTWEKGEGHLVYGDLLVDEG